VSSAVKGGSTRWILVGIHESAQGELLNMALQARSAKKDNLEQYFIRVDQIDHLANTFQSCQIEFFRLVDDNHEAFFLFSKDTGKFQHELTVSQGVVVWGEGQIQFQGDDLEDIIKGINRGRKRDDKIGFRELVFQYFEEHGLSIPLFSDTGDQARRPGDGIA